MVKRVILGGILGGILLFNWGYVAHMLLPLGEMGVHILPDEAAVVGPIRSTVKEPGFYLFPGMDMSGKASESEQKAWAEKAKQGPVGVLIVQPRAASSSCFTSYGTELGTNIVSARPGGLAAGPGPGRGRLLDAQCRVRHAAGRPGIRRHHRALLELVQLSLPFVAGEAVDICRLVAGGPGAGRDRPDAQGQGRRVRVERCFDGVRGDAK